MEQLIKRIICMQAVRLQDIFLRSALVLTLIAGTALLGACGSTEVLNESQVRTSEETPAESADLSGERSAEEEIRKPEDPSAYHVFPHVGLYFPKIDAEKEYADRIWLQELDTVVTDGITLGALYFYPASFEDLEAMDQDEFIETADKVQELFSILSIDGGRGEKELRELLDASSLPAYELHAAGKAGDTSYFWLDTTDGSPEHDSGAVSVTESAAIEENEAAVLAKVREEIDAAKERILLFGAQDVVAVRNGPQLSFVTEDADGNSIRSEDVFGSHKITMLNIWTSWCGFCINEMPELERIHRDLLEKDCAVVGLMYESSNAGEAEACRKILEQKGVSYLNIRAPENVGELFYVSGFPTTYFIDSEGYVIGDPVVGAQVEKYEDTILKLLEALDRNAG